MDFSALEIYIIIPRYNYLNINIYDFYDKINNLNIIKFKNPSFQFLRVLSLKYHHFQHEIIVSSLLYNLYPNKINKLRYHNKLLHVFCLFNTWMIIMY